VPSDRLPLISTVYIFRPHFWFWFSVEGASHLGPFPMGLAAHLEFWVGLFSLSSIALLITSGLQWSMSFICPPFGVRSRLIRPILVCSHSVISRYSGVTFDTYRVVPSFRRLPFTESGVYRFETLFSHYTPVTRQTTHVSHSLRVPVLSPPTLTSPLPRFTSRLPLPSFFLTSSISYPRRT